jgi:hypothetical protein
VREGLGGELMFERAVNQGDAEVGVLRRVGLDLFREAPPRHLDLDRRAARGEFDAQLLGEAD